MRMLQASSLASRQPIAQSEVTRPTRSAPDKTHERTAMLNDLIHVHVKCGARVADMHFHADATLAEFKEQICKEFVLGDSTLRILHRGKALPVGDTESDQQLSSAQLSSLEIENNAKLYVMATSAKSRADVANHVPEHMRGFEEDDNRIMTGGVSTSKSYGSVSVRSTASRPSFRFHALQALEVPASAHPRKEAAERRLRELAEDPAVLAILAEHRWNVGALKEMPPEGLVGVSQSCLMGLNKNKGQEILLRLRTDDWRGLRSYNAVIDVLMHELAHNVHGDHDADFKALNSQLKREYVLHRSRLGQGRTTGAAQVFTPTTAVSGLSDEDGAAVLGGRQTSADPRRAAAEAALARHAPANQQR